MHFFKNKRSMTSGADFFFTFNKNLNLAMGINRSWETYIFSLYICIFFSFFLHHLRSGIKWSQNWAPLPPYTCLHTIYTDTCIRKLLLMFVINKGLDNYDNSVLCSASSKTFSLSSACQIVVVIKIYMSKKWENLKCVQMAVHKYICIYCALKINIINQFYLSCAV